MDTAEQRQQTQDAIDAVVAEVLAGNTDAFRDIVLMTQENLRAFVLWVCPARSVVDDIAQEAYLLAFRNLDKYTPGTSFSAWLRTIARNRVANHVRSAVARCKREKRFGEAAMLEHALEDDVVDAEYAQRRVEALRTCMGKLSETNREMLSLRYEGQRKSHEIARLLGRSAGAVRAALKRIRFALRDCVAAVMAGETAT
jgi:RNA polymerase sigma-70 factor (ECF subfamily)